tara:strand:+ start:545 stop:763 length:219 start_codon:yes stop_codon:yes gene_type:complete
MTTQKILEQKTKIIYSIHSDYSSTTQNQIKQLFMKYYQKPIDTSPVNGDKMQTISTKKDSQKRVTQFIIQRC